MTEENIVAVYDTAAHAAAAVQALEAANVPSGAITQHAATSGAAGGSSTATGREPGFWGKLFGGESAQDNAVYDRSMTSGSTVVTVRAPAEHIESVSRILELHNPIDIDQRAAGYGSAAATTTTTTQSTIGTPAAAVGRTATTAQAGTGEAIQLAEEQLVVGKRLVNRGTTRVRRYVVETPVEENVTLRSEQVSIERRPVTAGTTVADGFTDKVIEVTETAEEAVVGKTARVKEEVVIRKDAGERVETVRDTVRREDVEITRDATGATTGGSTSGTIPPVRPKV